MKYQLFTYQHSEGPRAGLTTASAWFDLRKLALSLDCVALADSGVDDLIARWGQASLELDSIAAHAASEPSRFASAALDAERTTLHAPLTRPGAIYAAGANYRDHVEAMARAFNMKLVLVPK